MQISLPEQLADRSRCASITALHPEQPCPRVRHKSGTASDTVSFVSQPSTCRKAPRIRHTASVPPCRTFPVHTDAGKPYAFPRGASGETAVPGHRQPVEGSRRRLSCAQRRKTAALNRSRGDPSRGYYTACSFAEFFVSCRHSGLLSRISALFFRKILPFCRFSAPQVPFCFVFV